MKFVCTAVCRIKINIAAVPRLASQSACTCAMKSRSPKQLVSRTEPRHSKGWFRACWRVFGVSQKKTRIVNIEYANMSKSSCKLTLSFVSKLFFMLTQPDLGPGTCRPTVLA